MKQNLISAKQDFDKYLQTNLAGKPKTSTQDSITAKESQIKEILKESNDKVNLTNQEQSDNIKDEVLSNNINILEPIINEEESLNEEKDEDSLSSILSYIDDNLGGHQEKLYESSPSSFDESSSSSSTSNSFCTHDFSSDETNEDSIYSNIRKEEIKQKSKGRKIKYTKINRNKKSHKLTSDKVCSQALQTIKFLGTLHMRKLDLKHKHRLRRIAFLEWISQLEIAFSSNKYTTKELQDYSTKNKIHSIKSKLADSLVYTVAYAFKDKATRTSTIAYKSQGSKLLKILHMKCASVDESTKLRARMQFLSCQMTFEETAIKLLHKTRAKNK